MLLFIISSALLLSCREREDRKSITITDFSKSFSDTLYPNENSTYAAVSVEIKGEVNDSIILEFHARDAIPLYFNGRIDERITFDYYGGGPQIFIFKPYKATEGKLEIKYGLYWQLISTSQ